MYSQTNMGFSRVELREQREKDKQARYRFKKEPGGKSKLAFTDFLPVLLSLGFLKKENKNQGLFSLFCSMLPFKLEYPLERTLKASKPVDVGQDDLGERRCQWLAPSIANPSLFP